MRRPARYIALGRGMVARRAIVRNDEGPLVASELAPPAIPSDAGDRTARRLVCRASTSHV